jgi:hypothetical protein
MRVLRRWRTSARTVLLLAWAGFTAASAFANTQVPPIDSPWTSSDYVEAIFAVENGLITLPRQGNPKTEALFNRLVDRSNIETLMASALAPAEKRREILIILSATGEFRGRYGYALALGDDVRSELVAIQIFRLYLIDRLTTLDMQDGAARRHSADAFATALSGTLDTLAETPLFTTDQLLALCAAFKQHYPAIRTKLATAEHQDILARLQKMAASQSDPMLKSAFAMALKAARGSN